MVTPTNVQIIEQGGKPMFAVIPYEDYLLAFNRPAVKSVRIPQGDSIPNDVVNLMFNQKITLVRAWREYLGLTQDEVEEKMGITQSALAQIETSTKPRKATRQKLAEALGINVEQLI